MTWVKPIPTRFIRHALAPPLDFYVWIAFYAAGPLAADDEASMLELLLLGGGVLLFCLLIAYERLTNRL